MIDITLLDKSYLSLFKSSISSANEDDLDAFFKTVSQAEWLKEHRKQSVALLPILRDLLGARHGGYRKFRAEIIKDESFTDKQKAMIFRHACKQSKQDEAQKKVALEILDLGLSANWESESKKTLLHVAARYGHQEAAEKIVRNSRHWFWRLIAFFTRRPAPILLKVTKVGKNVLHYAGKGGDLGLFNELWKKTGLKIGGGKESPLFEIYRANHFSLYNSLKEQHPLSFDPDTYQVVPDLTQAIEDNHFALAKKLCKNLTSENLKECESILDKLSARTKEPEIHALIEVLISKVFKGGKALYYRYRCDLPHPTAPTWKEYDAGVRHSTKSKDFETFGKIFDALIQALPEAKTNDAQSLMVHCIDQLIEKEWCDRIRKCQSLYAKKLFVFNHSHIKAAIRKGSRNVVQALLEAGYPKDERPLYQWTKENKPELADIFANGDLSAIEEMIDAGNFEKAKEYCEALKPKPDHAYKTVLDKLKGKPEVKEFIKIFLSKIFDEKSTRGDELYWRTVYQEEKNQTFSWSNFSDALLLAQDDKTVIRKLFNACLKTPPSGPELDVKDQLMTHAIENGWSDLIGSFPLSNLHMREIREKKDETTIVALLDKKAFDEKESFYWRCYFGLTHSKPPNWDDYDAAINFAIISTRDNDAFKKIFTKILSFKWDNFEACKVVKQCIDQCIELEWSDEIRKCQKFEPTGVLTIFDPKQMATAVEKESREVIQALLDAGFPKDRFQYGSKKQSLLDWVTATKPGLADLFA